MVRLDHLVNVLGGYGVRLRCCPVSRATLIRSVAMFDATGAEEATGDILLAVGAGSVRAAVAGARAAKAVAVLVRGGAGADREAAAIGSEDGVAVLMVDPAVSWSQLAGVVYGLVLEGRETASGRGPTDLFALADSLAAAVDGAVTIEDPLSRVMAHATLGRVADRALQETVLQRRQPAALRELFESRGVPAHLAGSDAPVFVEPDPGHGLDGRMAVAVRVGRELLGSVWVTCTEPMPDARRAALADGARTVALHLLRSRASADLERQVESELVIRLLEGSPDATTVVGRLGLASAPLRVVAVRAQIAAERHAGLLLAFEQATFGFGWSRPGRSTLSDNTVYTILPSDRVQTARNWVTALRTALPARVTLSAGIGGPATAADLPASRQEADECLALHEQGSAGSAYPAYDESWGEILLQRLRAAARTGRIPARGPVAELRRYDSVHATDFVATLRAWLDAQGDPVVAAAGLGVHPNTVRNRMRKMREVAVLELEDARTRLAMTIDLAAFEDG
ncbi:helix-turn-helix domain-containing protein [Nocardia zapadnayensis]|uniref:PucR family transcriptional regulator n=1 Tax=Nocardia rhamnosiphila TaxID=426716 RepID=UPI002245BE2F|nr:helix-turn-helix domain-containing protein [Nocardia zapadnayensis]MCX0273389.1 helix-turn-helix domain-containing protein [Nocardia zapadnayensis]